jgi:hypothetical protein
MVVGGPTTSTQIEAASVKKVVGLIEGSGKIGITYL